MTLSTFSISMAYAAPSFLLYDMTAIIIVWHWSTLRSSFFQFYLFEFAMNTLTFLNGLLSIRLPSVTCDTCPMSAYFRSRSCAESSVWNQFQYAMTFHMAYVQYATTAVVAVNRLTIILDHKFWEKKWRDYSWMCMILLYTAPFIVTYPVFQNRTYFQYDPVSDRFSINCDYKSSTMFSYLVPVMSVSTLITMCSNAFSFCRLLKLAYKPHQLESNFLTVTIVASLTQLLGTALSITMLFGEPGSWLFNATNVALPFVSDALTLIQPYLLLIFCRGIRKCLLGVVLYLNCLIPIGLLSSSRGGAVSSIT